MVATVYDPSPWEIEAGGPGVPYITTWRLTWAMRITSLCLERGKERKSLSQSDGLKTAHIERCGELNL